MLKPTLLETPGVPDLRSELTTTQLTEYLRITLSVAEALRSAVSKELAAGLSIELKSDKTVVTRADLQGETAVRTGIEELLPDAGILGEEFGHKNPEAPLQFVTDPVDGTLDLSRGIPTWGSVLALYYKGHPIVGTIHHPSLSSGSRIQACYQGGAHSDNAAIALLDNKRPAQPLIAVSAPLGFKKASDESAVLHKLLEQYPQSRMIFTCYSQSGAARGAFDATIEWNLRLWDLASLRILMEEVGGKYSELRRHVTPKGETLYSVVAGRAELVDELVNTIYPLIQRR